jgi:hypothetical protein
LSAGIFPLADWRISMIKLTKNVLGAGAAAAALVTMSVPAQARDDYYKRDGISAGEVIAGAVVLGGIAAVLSSSSNNDRYNDRDYRGDDSYNRGDDRYSNHDNYDNDRSRDAVNECIRTVERNSSRYNRTKVTDIREVNRTRRGYQVSGRVAVQDGYGHHGGRYDDDNRYDRGQDHGYNSGRFTCYIERGRVVDIDYNGRNNWR